ncbi:uncharacterized protein [Henckelia pumila]|uniref:uncharacterized protein n=1 Tax=Henckelia pumila TaxID=405737 RepID=UPI003C6E377B
MANIALIISTLAILSAMQGCMAIVYSATNTARDTPGGVRFNTDIGAQYSLQTMTDSTNFILGTFQENDPSDRKDVAKVHPRLLRFLDYCNGLSDGFVAELNKKMRIGYNVNFFVDLLGNTVDELWSDYKAEYN